MKRTVLQAFLSIRDPEFRKFVFDNLDDRYLESTTYTLGNALTFGVHTHGIRANSLKLENYLSTNLRKDGNEVPLFKHDCACCIYLGEFDGEDLYYHGSEKDAMITVIARFGNQGGEYASGLVFGEMEKEDLTSSLGEAYRRAKMGGLRIPKNIYQNG